jgi:glycosyltransferase involved in cell wall biosynthesis
VLRLCSVFEPPDAVLCGKGVRFDPIGGMQNHAGQLTRALAERGVRQTVVTARPPGAPRHEAFARGVLVHRHGLRVPFARQLYSLPGTLTALRHAGRADLVHAHLGEDLAVLPIARAAARRAGAPLVVTVHTSLRHTFLAEGPRALLLEVLGGRIEEWGTRHAARVIALTPRLAARLADGGIPLERIHVIPSGVVAADFSAPVEDPFPHLPRPRVLFLGRLARQKGVATLIEAAARLRHPGATLLVVGDGPERRAAEQAVARAGIGHRVRFTGFLPHHAVAAVLRHADVFAMPSIYEELGTVLLEAMQAGLPIVASDTGGIPGALGDAGVLVSPGDPAALAAAVDSLLDDPDRGARLGARARERAGGYEWGALAGRVLDVYAAALGTAPERVPALASPTPTAP